MCSDTASLFPSRSIILCSLATNVSELAKVIEVLLVVKGKRSFMFSQFKLSAINSLWPRFTS